MFQLKFGDTVPLRWLGAALFGAPEDDVRRRAGDASALGLWSCTIVHRLMEFEWDVQKARLNARKHGIQFADAVLVLEDDSALTTTEQSADGEERWITLGVDALSRILIVVYTWRENRIRIISARPATPGERKRYTEGS